MEKAPTLTVAVYGSRHQGENAKAISALLRELSERGCRLLIHPKLLNHLNDLLGDSFSQSINLYGSPADVDFKADLALSIGGDGTILRTARWVADKEIPILAINSGNLGDLTAFDIRETSLIAD
ncbi:MAG: NAD(+)/NADH kinase, partial [Muribaculaceae bacterium]|nr:NAD(+)/NADH kinase [Muribaculaceae bacterium]